MKQIVIKISPEGIIDAETVNMKGHECQKYVSVIEELTGSVAVESKYKDSFYQSVDSNLDNAVEEQEKIESSLKT